MQSLRRLALSSGLRSAARAVAPKGAATPFSTLFAHNGARVVIPTVALRSFSQASRLAFSEESKSPIESALEQNASRTSSEPANYEKRSRAAQNETDFGLFVRNIVFEATEVQLQEIFGKYGEVAHAAIGRDSRGLSRGFGFVYFNNAEDMNNAAANVDGSFWQGRRLQCSPRTRKTERRPQQINNPTSSLFIGNIPYETTDAELNRLFDGIPNLADVRVAVDRTTGWPRGFAHADFTDTESAVHAKQQLVGARLGSREIRVDFASESRSSSPRTSSPRRQRREE